ncbi:MAG: hypothetical protein RMK91_09290 [Pseudanabaenaceae cyanobacterium SKYGB_i_bin29]|nr:hypothetical protein [Pseudanabaenaceae cyanobacterium SKYG29]MDW8422049.1 hypothetical protein [Pseudanabaenaceae cyanobacterium SKYGB_i_bin29]
MDTRQKAWQGELIKAWHWVVFMFRLLQQMGGIRGILQALGKTIAILVKRAFA